MTVTGVQTTEDGTTTAQVKLPYFYGPVDQSPIQIVVDWRPVENTGTVLAGSTVLEGTSFAGGKATWTSLMDP